MLFYIYMIFTTLIIYLHREEEDTKVKMEHTVLQTTIIWNGIYYIRK